MIIQKLKNTGLLDRDFLEVAITTLVVLVIGGAV